jgi:phosphoglycolate phosphatase-like HAD superfamily hydrolase
MQNVIFDLDGTIICSKHRYRSLENGGIDLPYWIQSNTRENCFKDTVLPAIRTIRSDYKNGCNIIICTARVLSKWDFEFFDFMNIPFHHMLDRRDSILGDADLKELRLRNYCSNNGISWAKFCQTSMFFEDADTVLERMEKIGIPTIDARLWNKQLSMVA